MALSESGQIFIFDRTKITAETRPLIFQTDLKDCKCFDFADNNEYICAESKIHKICLNIENLR